jgi:hypothetical protein
VIRAIANKKLDLSKEEYDYYLELEKSFGPDAFIGLFKTDNLGRIISVTPSVASPTATVLIFFFLNVMLNQRLRSIDNGLASIANLEKRVTQLEETNRYKS